MKTQTHNQGELKELHVNIESQVVESLETMVRQSKMSIDEIVVVALKRYIASHAELLGKAPKFD
tara:strand:- start:3590 stop:3781 length:192 start_codon:yes stop_codon:yes gene_type:complete